MSAEGLLDRLRDPACYPHSPPAVQVLQTHLSVVCLAGELVFKLKKAKTLPFVDFGSLSARRRFCREEVRLNRRLCADTYLGTCSLRATGAALRFSAVGDDDGPDDLDVAVVMRRLPADLMLDELVRRRAVSSAEIETLARRVAHFHATAERSPEAIRFGSPDRLAQFARDNFTELRALEDHGLPTGLLDAMEKATNAAFAALLPRMRGRSTRGCVVDGHGDLHARNVCMTDPPTIYDCIEFAPAFRCGDTATENAFLVMDLRYRGAPHLAAAYLQAYERASGDHEQHELMSPLCAYRAMVRGKVAALAAAEPELSEADRAGARASARRHLLLAAAMTIEAGGPQWLIVFGPPASGKTALCTHLAAIAQWRHIATDAVRKDLAGLHPTERARPEHYTKDFSDRTYAEVQVRAALAGDEPSVVLVDGNFADPRRRAEIARAAKAQGISPIFLYVNVDVATARERAARRLDDSRSISDADPDRTTTLHASFVPPTAAEALRVITLDGAMALHELIPCAMRELLG